MSETTLLYFCSALAQSSAAFSAIVAVFAVFRLQANNSAIQDRYSEGRDCLHMGWKYRESDARVKRELEYKAYELKDDSDSGKKAREEAKVVLQKINDAEALNGRLANEVGGPLKLWGGIFLFSLGILSVAGFYPGRRGFLVVAGFLVATTFAIWRTKRFVQRCLKS